MEWCRTIWWVEEVWWPTLTWCNSPICRFVFFCGGGMMANTNMMQQPNMQVCFFFCSWHLMSIIALVPRIQRHKCHSWSLQVTGSTEKMNIIQTLSICCSKKDTMELPLDGHLSLSTKFCVPFFGKNFFEIIGDCWNVFHRRKTTKKNLLCPWWSYSIQSWSFFENRNFIFQPIHCSSNTKMVSSPT